MTNRWILGDVLGDTTGGSNCVGELVAEDTGGLGGHGVGACFAGEFEGVGFEVFFGVEHVGTARGLVHDPRRVYCNSPFSAEAKCDLSCFLFFNIGYGTRHGYGVYLYVW